MGYVVVEYGNFDGTRNMEMDRASRTQFRGNNASPVLSGWICPKLSVWSELEPSHGCKPEVSARKREFLLGAMQQQKMCAIQSERYSGHWSQPFLLFVGRKFAAEPLGRFWCM